MSTVSCTYRFYLAWFAEKDSLAKPMQELANGAAARMGRLVENIEIVGNGEDQRGGQFIDAKVTYSSTASIPWEAA